MRANLTKAVCAALPTLLLVAPAAAQNRGDCGGREPTVGTAVVAGLEEPGERLVVSGRVLSDGGEPVAGATVHVFQTDAEGYYSPGGMDESNARLCALVVTNAEGRYRLETIKPAHYATGGPPAHIHFRVWGEGFRRQGFTLNFEGDPLLGQRGRDASANPTWATVRPVRAAEDGVLHVERDLKLR